MRKNETNFYQFYLNFNSTNNQSLVDEKVNDIFIDKTIGLDNLSSADMKLSDLEEKILIFIFSIVIIFGVFGNALVIWTVLFNKQMRTSNNLFVLNLAISDLTLCLFSIPFNVYKTLRHTWKFGSFLCKFSPFFQASNVFISTISITAIALDR
jgi:neuropeptide Y receptor